ncbi:hypothetical protein [Aliarcobacter butzleri]|uniref:hypothetical protein n=1 Tax=Aliarcobacter butzleri TaxID=28197 RepID=UPI0021B48A0E|nr:hypothetical protein [Aliarcobacter butzleri]UWY61411.1 hypothetical protein N3115_11070 [Aliarcobacter butzleri]
MKLFYIEIYDLLCAKVELINRYEVIKKDLEVDKKEVILNMFIISTKLIEKLKKVDFKFNSMKQKNKKR